MPRARRIWRAVVVDRSMEPALRPGDRLLVLPAGPNGLPWLRGAPRDALVADFSGLTRDRHYGDGKHAGRSFIVL